MSRLAGITIFILLFLCSEINAQTIIRGTEKTYSGKQISLISWSDYFTSKPDTIATCQVKENGDFSFNFSISETQPVYVDMGSYMGLLYAEPGRNYKVALPPYKAKSTDEVLNPYFKPTEIYLDIINPDPLELNFFIQDFENYCTKYIQSKFFDVYRKPRKSGLDSAITFIDTSISCPKNKYFNEYKFYKFAFLKYFAFQRDEGKAATEFLKGKPKLYHNPMYMEMVTQLFHNYYRQLVKGENGDKIAALINDAKSFSKLKKELLKMAPFADDELSEMVILKSLYDALLINDLKDDDAFVVLDSMVQTSKYTIPRKYAKNILEKFRSKKSAIKEIEFNLVDLDSTLHKSEDYYGKYLYLEFVHSKSFACKEDVLIMKNKYNSLSPNLNVLYIFTDSDINDVKKFVKTNSITWPVLWLGNNSGLLNKYGIKVFPTAVFIDISGSILQFPARTMKDNFEVYFLKNFVKKSK